MYISPAAKSGTMKVMSTSLKLMGTVHVDMTRGLVHKYRRPESRYSNTTFRIKDGIACRTRYNQLLPYTNTFS